MPFDRRVSIDIYRKGATIALRVEGLRISFDIQKDIKTPANTARVQIYNLGQEIRSSFSELTDRIIVRAGYADESIDEIFTGDLVSVSHPRTDADIITTIEANDGQKAIRESYSSISYAEGASFKQIIQDISKQMGLPIKTEDYLSKIDDQKFLQGFSFNGPTKAALDKLVARGGLEWSIQGNSLQILKKGGVVPKDIAQIPVVSPTQGLIGSPARTQMIKSESPEKKPPGWTIKSLLIPRLEPGGQIGLQCADVPKATAYRIQSVHHQGDTHGDEFVSITEVVDPGVLIG